MGKNKTNEEKPLEAIQRELLTLKKPFATVNADEGYMFQKQLNQAILNVKTIVEQVDGNETNKRDLKSAYVFGLSGERGSGKTSFLQTFKAYLDDQVEQVQTLDIIDPGVISKSLSLIEILVAQIYQSIIKDITTATGLTIFDELKSVIQVMADLKGGRENFYVDVPNMAILEKIGMQANFETKIKDLIKSYLTFVGKKTGKKKSLLVLLVDDLDIVGRNEISQMLEDVRKYLPENVLAILAYREAQLLSNVFQDKLAENKQLLEVDGVTVADVRQQAARYLEKLIPMDYRIQLLSQMELQAMPVWLILQDCEETCKHFGVDKDNQKTFEKFVEAFIYDHTRIRINPISQKEQTKHYLPGNLRGMIQLLSVLATMRSLDDCDITKQREVIMQNLMMFKTYFLQRSKEILDSVHSGIVEGWENERLERKHFYIYHEIRGMVLGHIKERKTSNLDKLNMLFNLDSSLLETYNFTIANVYSSLENYKDMAQSEQAYDFVYTMKVLYSMLLLQQILDGYKREGDFSLYQTFVGGKIIPDDFAYNSRKKATDLYISIPKEEWEKLTVLEQKLINKMLYTDIPKESGLRTGLEGEWSYNRYRRIYYSDMEYPKSKFAILPIDPFSAVLKSDFLKDEWQYKFYSMFDIDVILRLNFRRNDFSIVLRKLSEAVSPILSGGQHGEKSSLLNNVDLSTGELACSQIYKSGKGVKRQSNSLYREEECNVVERLLELAQNNAGIDITKKGIVKTKGQAMEFIDILSQKILASGVVQEKKTQLIKSLRNIQEELEIPKTWLKETQRKDIELIRIEADVIITEEELNKKGKMHG